MCIKKRNLQRAVGDALKNYPQDLLPKPFTSIEEVLSVDITGCYDDEGNTVDLDCLENCKSGSFDASVKIEETSDTLNKTSFLKTVSGSFKVTDYDPKTYSFTVLIQIYH